MRKRRNGIPRIMETVEERDEVVLRAWRLTSGDRLEMDVREPAFFGCLSCMHDARMMEIETEEIRFGIRPGHHDSGGF